MSAVETAADSPGLSWRSPPRTGRRVVVIVVVLALTATSGLWVLLRSGQTRPVALLDRASSLATITERTITSQQLVSGILGFAGATSVLQPVGTPPNGVVQAELKASTAEQTLLQARAELRAAEAALAADQKTLTQARASVTSAELSSAAARLEMSGAHRSALAFGPTSTYTALPAIGQIVARGQPLYSINAQAVPLLYGPVPAWRAFRMGIGGGADVASLNQNLADLGYGADLAGSEKFSSLTAAAIRKLQGALGLPRTGELLLGAAVFQPGPVRVTGVRPTTGAAVEPGAPVLDVTSTTRQITVKLVASQQTQVELGDQVVVTLPDRTTTPATVSEIGTVAVAPASSGTESGSSSQPTVDVVITPSDSEATGDLDAAPVQVTITTATAEHALVVPVTALLALSGGGYGIDVVAPSGAHHLEAVTLGLFDDAEGLVQISGAAVRAGDQVAVAS